MTSARRIDHKKKDRFMVAHFPGEVKRSQSFDEWPPHVTIFPWFVTYEATAVDRFMRVIRVLERRPVDLTPKPLDQVAMYGAEGDVRVREIGESTSLGVIHGVCLSAFEEFLADGTYVAGAYSPHESEHPGHPERYANPKLSVVVDSLCLVMRRPRSKLIVCAEKLRRPTECTYE